MKKTDNPPVDPWREGEEVYSGSGKSARGVGGGYTTKGTAARRRPVRRRRR